jgi:hypothetical protein
MQSREEQSKPTEKTPKEPIQRKRRFQIIKLEERIAPTKGAGSHGRPCGGGHTGDCR